MRLRLPSLISPPEAASPSLPPLAPALRGRLLSGLSAVTLSRIVDALRCGPGAGAEELGGKAGDLGREGGPLGVEVPVPGWRVEGCLFLCFLRADSLPLASERLGEPGRLREAEEDRWLGSFCFEGRPEGVEVPLVEVPEGGWGSLSLSFSEAVFFSSSSFLRCSSFRRSSSESSDSLYFKKLVFWKCARFERHITSSA